MILVLVVQVREIEELRLGGERYPIDGYHGVRFFSKRFAGSTRDA
jgi:hypothetical protein